MQEFFRVRFFHGAMRWQEPSTLNQHNLLF
jgi:hypothetical protein